MGSSCRRHTSSLRLRSLRRSMPSKKFRKSEMTTRHLVSQHLWTLTTALSTTTSEKGLESDVALLFFQRVAPSLCPRVAGDRAKRVRKTTIFRSHHHCQLEHKCRLAS